MPDVKCHIQHSRPIYESWLGVPKRYFTPQKHTITKHVHIHFRTLHGWFAINDQWSIQFLIHWNGIKWICTINIPTIHSHAAQKVGLNSFPPNSAPIQTAFHISNPTNLCTLSSILWFLRFPIFGELGIGLNGRWTWSGVGAESKQRKVGGATGPQVGERVNAQPMLDDGGEGFCGCDTILILIFSLVRITFVVGFLRMKIHVAFR